VPNPHGITTNVLTIGTRPIAPIATAIIGLLATATAGAGAPTTALNAAFPLDTPVLVTDVRAAIGMAGTGGTLKSALEAIADQASPVVIVVRVGVGVDETAQNTAVIGDTVDGQYTGSKALLAAEVQTGFRPRIIGAPGLDTQAVTTALVTVAQKLRAMVYARAIGDDIADAVLYRGNFDARELMLIWPDFTGGFVGDAVARALGLRAAIDASQGWNKTLSNVPVNGVTGLAKDIHFDIQDTSTDAGVLNDGQVTTLVRSNGFRFWGNRTCSDEPLFAFESATRTSQILQDEIAEGIRWAIDKPMTAGLIRDVIDTINARFRSLKAAGLIIGANAWFDTALNSESDLASGKVTIDYDFTPAAPAENLVLNQRITDRYYGALAA
jgi:phage tail sheath protein FI